MRPGTALRRDGPDRPPAAPAGDGSVLPVSRLLWRAPLVVEMGRADASPAAAVVSEFIVAPHRRAPAVLIPVSSHRAGAQAVLRPSEGSRGIAQVGRRAAWLALRTGLGRHLMRDRLYVCAPRSDPGSEPGGLVACSASIESYLRGVFGPDVLIALAVGPIRANRKPVLQVLTPSGRIVAFVKVGWNPLTRQLVADEARTLAGLDLARLGVVRPPAVLHTASWQDLELLAITPLIGSPRVRRDAVESQFGAMRALAANAGIEVSSLADSAFWDRVRERMKTVPDPRARDTLLAIHRIATDRWGETRLTFGAWHGDWTKWNMSWDGERVLLWDWERYETGVPVGLDAFHFALQSRLRSVGDVERAVGHVRTLAAALAIGMGVAGDDGALLLLCYLLCLLLRYENDSRDPMGAQLRPIAQSLQTVVARQVSAL